MRKQSHNLAIRQIDEMKEGLSLSKVPFKNESTARKALQILSSLIAPKIDVSSQRLNQWKNGESISEDREKEILIAAKQIFIGDLNKLEDSIDRELISMYGGRDGGNF